MSYKKHFHFWGEAVPARDLPSCGETMLQDTRGWLVRHATSFKLWWGTGRSRGRVRGSHRGRGRDKEKTETAAKAEAQADAGSETEG